MRERNVIQLFGTLVPEMLRNLADGAEAHGAVAVALIAVHSDGSVATAFHAADKYHQLLGGTIELQRRIMEEA